MYLRGINYHELRFDVETRNVATSKTSTELSSVLRFDVETRNVATLRGCSRLKHGCGLM